MTDEELRKAPTLALVIRWATEREEARAARSEAERDMYERRVQRLRVELVLRGVVMTSLASAIDADGSRQ